MSLPSDQSTVTYTGNDSTVTAYVVPFVFFDSADLVVTVIGSDGEETVLVETTDYAVTGGEGSTGSLVTTAAVPTTSQVRIDRTLPLTQETTFTDAGRFPSASVDRALDRLTMQVQQVDRKADRNFSVIDGGGA